MAFGILRYKNYVGTVDFYDGDYSGKLAYYENWETGKVEHIRDLVTFEAETIKELKVVFAEIVDEYIEMLEDVKKVKATFLKEGDKVWLSDYYDNFMRKACFRIDRYSPPLRAPLQKKITQVVYTKNGVLYQIKDGHFPPGVCRGICL